MHLSTAGALQRYQHARDRGKRRDFIFAVFCLCGEIPVPEKWPEPTDCLGTASAWKECDSILQEAEKLLGMETFMNRYVSQETPFEQQEMKQELQDWQCEVQMGTVSIKIVRCPEDEVCAKRCNDQRLCPQCWVPLRRSCQEDLVRNRAAALSNDMMIYYMALKRHVVKK